MKSLNIDCETGQETWVELTVDEIQAIEAKMAEALEASNIEPTIDEKLASVGLSIDDLKSALGL